MKGVKHIGREAAMKRASALLGELKPFEQWQQGLDPEWRAAIVRVFGSIETAYEAIAGGLRREAADPTPTVIRQGRDGVELVYR